MQQNFMAKINKASLLKAMLVGATIGLVLICVFTFSVKNPPLQWGNYWRVKPLLLTPFITAFGGAWVYLVFLVEATRFWQKALLLLAGIFGFIVALWMGMVLGLNGTLWD